MPVRLSTEEPHQRPCITDDRIGTLRNRARMQNFRLCRQTPPTSRLYRDSPSPPLTVSHHLPPLSLPDFRLAVVAAFAATVSAAYDLPAATARDLRYTFDETLNVTPRRVRQTPRDTEP